MNEVHFKDVSDEMPLTEGRGQYILYRRIL